MRQLIARTLSLTVALGVLALLVIQAGAAGCATAGSHAEPQSLGNATAPPPRAAPTTAAAAPALPPVAPPEYLPATKAAPVFYPDRDLQPQAPQPPPQQAAPQQQAAPR
jgi:hypothetical protein